MDQGWAEREVKQIRHCKMIREANRKRRKLDPSMNGKGGCFTRAICGPLKKGKKRRNTKRMSVKCKKKYTAEHTAL